MAYGNLSTNKFMPLRSYDAAAKYYADTKPIRGKDKQTFGVPLRADRKYNTAFYLREIPQHLVPDNPNSNLHNQPAKPAYAAHMYQTDVVTFFPDGTIKLALGYSSISTCDFANCYLPRQFFTQIFASKPCITDHHTRQNYVAPTGRNNTPVIIRPDPASPTNHLIDTSTVAQMHVRKVNLKLGAAARKLIKPLLDYAKTMHALGLVSLDTVKTMRGGDDMPRFHSLNAPSMAYLTEPNNFPRILSIYYTTRYYSAGGRLAEPMAAINLTRAKEDITDAAYTLYGAYYQEPLPLGAVHRNMRYTDPE